jgi:hypothetical protein
MASQPSHGFEAPVSPTALPPAAPASAPAGRRNVARDIGRVIRIPFIPVLWFLRLLVFRVAEKQGSQVISFTSYSNLIYCWPIIVVGFVNAGLASAGIGSPAVLGWIWLFSIVFTLVVMGTDLTRNATLGWALFVALILALGSLIHAKYQIPVLGAIYDHFAVLGVTFGAGMGRAMSELLLIVMVVVIVHAMLDGRHEISSREVTHRRFMRASESWPLSLNLVRLDWPDMLEMIAGCGAGHLLIVDQSRREVLRIPNVPFLWFFREEVNSVLEVMATTHVDAAAAPQVSQS